MPLHRLFSLLVLMALVLPAGEAAAQDECQAPSVRAFIDTPQYAIRTGAEEDIGVRTTGATSVTMAWADGTTTTRGVRDDTAFLRHVFRRVGRVQIVATATGPCGTSAPAGLTLDVRPPCARDRMRSVYDAMCDRERGLVVIRQRGLRTESSWLNFPCNDVLFPPQDIPPEPVARAAVCLAPTNPPEVPGLLPIRSHSHLGLRLGVPARGVRLALGGPFRPTTPYKRASLRGSSGRFWRIRLATVRRSTRLWIRIRRPLGDDLFVAGLRPQ